MFDADSKFVSEKSNLCAKIHGISQIFSLANCLYFFLQKFLSFYSHFYVHFFVSFFTLSFLLVLVLLGLVLFFLGLSGLLDLLVSHTSRFT
jgi:hypothetical protein